MGRYSKEMAHVVGSASSGTIIYTAPSGTSLGSARGARVTQVVVSNHAVVQRSYSLEHVHATGGTYRWVIAPVYMNPDETKIYNVNVVMQAGDQLAWGNSGADLTMMITGDEFTIGPSSSTDILIAAYGNGTALDFPVWNQTLIGGYSGVRVTTVTFYNEGTTPAAVKVARAASSQPVAGAVVPVNAGTTLTINQVFDAGNSVFVTCPSTTFFVVNIEKYIIGQ